MFSPNKNSYLARQIPDLARPNRNLGKFCFWHLVVLSIICNWIHFVSLVEYQDSHMGVSPSYAFLNKFLVDVEGMISLLVKSWV